MNAEDLFKKKIAQIDRAYSIEYLPETDEEFTKLLLFGDQWDDPEVVMQHVDEHPMWWARYARALKISKQLYEAAKEKIKYFDDDCKDVIEDLIFFENRLAGMTANNANPTKEKIERRYNLEVKHGDESDGTIFDVPSNMDEILKDNKTPAKYNTTDTFGGRFETYSELNKELIDAEDRLNLATINEKAFEKRDTMITQVVSLAKFLVEKDLAVFRGSLLKQKKVKSEADEHGYEGR